MKVKTLTSLGDLILFRDMTEEFLKIEYPIELLERSKVRALLDSNGVIRGGYILVMEGPFRVIESLPDLVRETSKFTEEHVLNETFEFTGLWLNPSVTSKRANFKFWSHIYLDICNSGKKYLVYAYGAHKKRLRELYQTINPNVIYEGPTKIQPGMQYEEVESVELASVNFIKWAIFHRGDFFVKKFMFSRANSSKYFHAVVPMISGSMKGGVHRLRNLGNVVGFK